MGIIRHTWLFYIAAATWRLLALPGQERDGELLVAPDRVLLERSAQRVGDGLAKELVADGETLLDEPVRQRAVRLHAAVHEVLQLRAGLAANPTDMMPRHLIGPPVRALNALMAEVAHGPPLGVVLHLAGGDVARERPPVRVHVHGAAGCTRLRAAAVPEARDGHGHLAVVPPQRAELAGGRLREGRAPRLRCELLDRQLDLLPLRLAVLVIGGVV